MADSQIGKELENLAGSTTELNEPDSTIGKILYKKLGHDVDYTDPDSVIGKLVEQLEVGGGGDEYEEVLIYQNPDPSLPLATNDELSFGTHKADDYEYLKININLNTTIKTSRSFIIKSDKETAFPVFIGLSRCCRGMGLYTNTERGDFLNMNTSGMYNIHDSGTHSIGDEWIIVTEVYGIRKKV